MLVPCPWCDGDPDCELCLGSGEVKDIDAAFPEAAIRKRKVRETFSKRKPLSKEEVLLASLKPETSKQWRCEEPLKPLLTAFAECWPECIPRGSKSSLYASARVILREVGEAQGDKFVRWAHEIIKHESPHLYVKDLRSLAFLVPRWRKEHTDYCPTCGLHYSECRCEWGARKRSSRYGRR